MEPNRTSLEHPAHARFTRGVQVADVRPLKPKPDGPYSAGETAALLGVHINTVRGWCDSEELRFFRTPGGHRRITTQAIDEMLARRLAAA